MNRKHRIFSALTLVGALMLTACNSSSESTYEVEISDMGSVAVKGFSLKSNTSVLNNLDSVYFSIDLNSAQIYNADSLPYGTDVSAIAVSITSDECSAIKIFSPSSEEGGEEKEINYLEDENAKINFAKGAVKMNVVSADGTHARDYFLSVNVHKMVPDSLYWSDAAYSKLPSAFSAPTEQKTVKSGYGYLYCFTGDGNSYSVSMTVDPAANQWYSTSVRFPKKVRLGTLSYASRFYVLATDGELLYSDNSYVWNATGVYWHSIIGAYYPSDTKSQLLGIRLSGGRYVHAVYPAAASGTEQPVAADFPVSGSSAVAEFSTKWASKPQIVILGGRTAGGSLSGATWAYDGTSWAKIGDGMPKAEDYTLFPYIISETDTVNWSIAESNVLMAFGGRSDAGISRDLYFSRDMGMTWHKGSSLLQLPEYMPTVTGVDAIIHKETLTANAEAGAEAQGNWTEIPLKKVPSCYAAPHSRAVSAIETWECPYIYLFGGVQENGALQNAVWRGVINHFSFRPLE